MELEARDLGHEAMALGLQFCLTICTPNIVSWQVGPPLDLTEGASMLDRPFGCIKHRIIVTVHLTLVQRQFKILQPKGYQVTTVAPFGFEGLGVFGSLDHRVRRL